MPFCDAFPLACPFLYLSLSSHTKTHTHTHPLSPFPSRFCTGYCVIIQTRQVLSQTALDCYFGHEKKEKKKGEVWSDDNVNGFMPVVPRPTSLNSYEGNNNPDNAWICIKIITGAVEIVGRIAPRETSGMVKKRTLSSQDTARCAACFSCADAESSRARPLFSPRHTCPGWRFFTPF
jgi:hypothetical protein